MPKTPKQILKMEPGLNLDSLITSEIFGLVICGTTKDPLDGKECLLSVGENAPCILPRYSTSIEGAFEVREWVIDNIGGVKIENVCDELPEYCDIWNGKEYIKAQGKTAAEAICKAALIAVIKGGAKF